MKVKSTVAKALLSFYIVPLSVADADWLVDFLEALAVRHLIFALLFRSYQTTRDRIGVCMVLWIC